MNPDARGVVDDGRSDQATHNPFAPPSAVQLEASTLSYDPRIQAVAKFQRYVNLSILANIGTIAAIGLLSALEIKSGDAILGFVYIGVALFGFGSAVCLAKQLFGTIAAVLVAPLMLVPLVNLLIILVLSSRATTMLRDAGYKVGLLGVDPAVVAAAQRS